MKKISFFIITLFAITYSRNIYSQCISGDCVNGQGSKLYSSGSRYTGEFKDGKEHGQGIYYFFNGTRYEGEFKNGNFDGKGKINYSNGIESKGNFINGQITNILEIVEKKDLIEAADIVSILPADIDFMIKFKSLNSIYRNFSIRSNSIYGKKMSRFSRISQKTGINPLTIWDLKNIGIDTAKELGLIISKVKLQNEKINDVPQMDIIAFIPVFDGSKLINIISDKTKNYKDIDIVKDGNVTILQKKNKKEKIYLSQKNNYIFIGINTSGDTQSFINLIHSGKNSLKDSNIYKSVNKRIDHRSDIFSYMDINNFIKNNEHVIKNFLGKNLQYEKKSIDATLKTLNDYLGAGFSLDLENTDFLLKTAYIVNDKSNAMDLMKGIKYNKNFILGIDKKPLLLFLFGLNVNKYYNYVIDTWPQKFTQNINDSFKSIKKEYNIEVVPEILKNLGGNFNIGIFDGGTINIFNYNTVITLTVNNVSLMENVIKKIIAKIPENEISTDTINGIKTYIYTKDMLKLYFGLKNNVLIISHGKSMYESALKAEIKSGFLVNLGDENLNKDLINDNSVFYLKVDETMKAINNFGGAGKNLSSEKITQINRFDYLLLSSKVIKDALLGQILIKTKFKEPFFISIKDIINADKKRNLKKNKNKIQ